MTTNNKDAGAKPANDDTSTTSTDNPPDETTDKGLEDEVQKWKALARKHEAQAKANADAARKLAEIEDANKTEIERANEKAAAAEKRAADAEAKLLKLEVAAEKGLTLKQAKRLQGTTREELEADADEILEEFGGAGNGDKPKPPPSSKPKEDLRGGGDPTEEPEETDPRKLAEFIPPL